MSACVLLVCNRDYMGYAAALAREITAVEPGGFDLLLASPDTLTSDAVASGLIHRPIVVSDFIEALPVSERLKHYTYWRLPAIEAASASYDRILYLDIDIVCAAPGIGQLLSLDLQGKTIAAVLDVHHHYRPRRLVRDFESVGLAQAPYFNAGVLLIDGDAWRSQNRFARIEGICGESPHALFCHDQSALNISFHKDWLEISPIWNWQFSKKNSHISLHAGARLIHFAGLQKIWSDTDRDLYRSHWLRFSRSHALDVRRDWDRVAEESRRNIISGLWYRQRLLKYLSRFPSDMSTFSHN